MLDHLDVINALNPVRRASARGRPRRPTRTRAATDSSTRVRAAVNRLAAVSRELYFNDTERKREYKIAPASAVSS